MASGDQHAFLWTAAGGMVDLGTLGGSLRQISVTGVNDSGRVVGYGYLATGEQRAFSWTAADGMVGLGTLGGSRSEAHGVNSSGKIVGYSHTASGDWHAFSWTAATGMVDLGTLGGPYSFGTAVSDSGQVIGSSYTASGESHAVLWTAAGGMVDLGHLGGSSSAAIAVSASGLLVVGYSYTASGDQHAFSWSSAGGMVDLGTLGGLESVALGVTTSGQVAGYSQTPSGVYHAVVWDVPVPVASDTTAPTATISVPVDGATYDLGSTVAADYSCSDDVALAVTGGCVGTVPDGSSIDTSVIGTHSLSVTATDAAGLTATTTSSYTVSGTLAAGLALTGTFTSIPVGYTVTAVDAGAAGVTITVTGSGTAKVVMSVCAGGFTVQIAPGSIVTLACGSVIAKVVAGSVQVDLTNAAGLVTMTVVAGGIATLKNNGDVVVAPESAVPVSVTIGGVTQIVLPGRTSDTLAPTAAPSRAPAPNAAGWNKTDVTVSWHWTDESGGSGIDVAHCTTSSMSTGQGASIVVSAACSDLAGNAATASVAVKVDRTPPVIVCPASPKRGLNAAGSTLTAAVADAGGSGVASSSVTVAAPTNVAGARSVTVSATDVAGNTASVSCGYQVIYTVQWLLPVGGVASPRSVLRNTVVPFTFQLVDANGAAVNSAVVSAPTSTVIACPSGAPPLVLSVAGNATTRNLGSGRWLAGWKAETAWKGTCRSVRIGLSDGTTITAIYKVV